MTIQDDPEDFLERFERAALSSGLDKGHWTEQLGAFWLVELKLLIGLWKGRCIGLSQSEKGNLVSFRHKSRSLYAVLQGKEKKGREGPENFATATGRFNDKMVETHQEFKGQNLWPNSAWTVFDRLRWGYSTMGLITLAKILSWSLATGRELWQCTWRRPCKKEYKRESLFKAMSECETERQRTPGIPKVCQ